MFLYCIYYLIYLLFSKFKSFQFHMWSQSFFYHCIQKIRWEHTEVNLKTGIKMFSKLNLQVDSNIWKVWIFNIRLIQKFSNDLIFYVGLLLPQFLFHNNQGCEIYTFFEIRIPPLFSRRRQVKAFCRIAATFKLYSGNPIRARLG